MNRKLKNVLSILAIVIVGALSFGTMILAKNSVQDTSKMQNFGNPPNMSNAQEPPAKPEGSSENENGSQTKQENSNGANAQEPPTKPESLNGESKTSEIEVSYYILFAIEAMVISILIIYLIMSNFNKKTARETLNNGIKIVIFIIATIAVTIALTFLQTYLTKSVFLNKNISQEGSSMQEPNGGMNGNNNDISYTAIKEITEDTNLNNETISSTTANENGVLVNGEVNATLSGITVNKSGNSDGGDTSNFYGNNSAILAKSKANLTLKNATITTNASGANGVFSYGGSATTNNSSSDGTTVSISDSTITTTGDNAGGIMTTGGGKTVASNLIINTSGTSSAAIRTDRGGGIVTVDKGTYTTEGKGSPTIYSTADITVSNSDLISKASEGVVIEGKNSVTLNNCNLVDDNNTLNGQSTTYKNIFLYQSMSGDASTGTATFTAKDSNITTNKGDSFYITNTTATINLTNNTIINNDTDGNFLRAKKDSWGSSGSNGGNVTLVMNNQKALGNIVIDSISTLNMTMENGSYYEGAINKENEAKSIALKIDSSSKIKLTGDSYVTSFEDGDSSCSNIDFNGYKLFVNGVAIN